MPEPAVNQLISVHEAIRILDVEAVTPRIVRMPLARAVGLVMAEDVRADRDDPPFDKSQMDGYAVRSDGPMTARIVGDIAAGSSAEAPLREGEVMSIMTGAPLPAGADAVIPIEQSERSGDTVTFSSRPRPGQSIARRGSDCAAGDVILAAGTRIAAVQVAVAASAGAVELSVYARPGIALIGTGDEIVPLGVAPGPHQIRNSNSAMLAALLGSFGCEAVDLGIVRDQPQLIRDRLEAALLDHEALFVTGGMSMGSYDYVPRLLLEMGFELRISKVKIKPGKPFVFAVRRGQFIFGLPGNPVSGYVCTVRLASRLLARMAGGAPAERWSLGKLAAGVPANGPREFYQPVKLDCSARPDRSAQTMFPTVRPMVWKASSDIYTLAKADALLVRAENEPPMPVGTVVSVLQLP